METTKTLMQLENISMVFEKREKLFAPPTRVKALDGVSLDINPGEIFAIVGESGCGKTTMGNIITKLLDPSEGRVIFNGVDVAKMNKKQFEEYRNGVQMVQQDSYAALNPNRTILQSLTAPLLQKKIVKNKAEAYERVCEHLKTVELSPPDVFLEKFPHQLSGGQRQRILMARAISLNPKLIVADEPVSMIDVSLRIAMLNLMSNLNKKLGIAFVYITHDLATARYIANNGRIAVMYLGKIIETGEVNEVIMKPKHPYLQALLSAVPIPDPLIAKVKKKLPLKNLDMPSITNIPKGCRFNPRCIYAETICENEEPKLIKCDSGMIACHNLHKIPNFELSNLMKEEK